MKRADLARYEAALRENFNYDPLRGLFTWRRRVARCVQIGSVAGTLHKRIGYVYLAVTLDGKTRSFFAHRVAWLLATNEWPSGVIDHINGVKSDNRIENLRDTSQAVNAQNVRRAFASNKSSGLLGAHYHSAKGLWAAEISINGKNKHLGYFASAEEAHKAYLASKAIHHPEAWI